MWLEAVLVPEFLELLAPGLPILTELFAGAFDGALNLLPDELKLYDFWKMMKQKRMMSLFGVCLVGRRNVPIFAERATNLVVLLGEAHVDAGVLR